MAGKLYFLFREAVEKEQHNYTRHTNFPRDGRNHFVFRRGRRKIAPTLKIVCQEIVSFIGRNDVSVACVDKRERAPGCADVDRLPQAIEYQNLTV